MREHAAVMTSSLEAATADEARLTLLRIVLKCTQVMFLGNAWLFALNWRWHIAECREMTLRHEMGCISSSRY